MMMNTGMGVRDIAERCVALDTVGERGMRDDLISLCLSCLIYGMRTITSPILLMEPQ